MSLKSSTNFSEGVSRLSLAQQIIADPSLVAWFSSRTTDLTLASSSVATMKDRAGGALTLDAAAPHRPTLVGATFGTVAGVLFDGADDVLSLTGTFDRSAPFTIAAVLRAEDGVLCSSFNGVSQQTTVLVEDGQMNFNHGAGFVAADYDNGSDVLVIASSAGYRISLRVGDAQSVFAVADNNGGVATFCVGALNGLAAAPLDGRVAELWLFGAEILNPDALGTLDALRAYVAAIYPDVAI